MKIKLTKNNKEEEYNISISNVVKIFIVGYLTCIGFILAFSILLLLFLS